ncbi:helix-turn-helix DNA-binding domain protein [Arthrobacter phage Auxilium]|uniref:Helix-turn-helix DNA-binding domain protein n=1 Tax=Arthrobacter phage Auxilium TaxID=2419948 RepID=A0A3G2KA26_9CAUD|nr:helix-turn-helix DNA-binding domain protein [Arthrobacter phage Auxilium]AYN55828.1 helix-turn-helix DNA-binding domain protein [Arthrobacter phage Auxilium]
MARLTINHEALERLRNEQPWGVFAEQLGIDGGTLSRIRNGESQPGPKFIANAVTRFPIRMDELVHVVVDDEKAAA